MSSTADLLAAEAVRLAAAKGAMVGVAESCTGGLLGAALTAVAGASSIFTGGVIAYANGEKVRALGVPPALLEAHCAVSRPAAEAMAQGCRDRLGVTFAVAVTGIAGPGGGTPDKPVGTVWLAVASPAGVVSRLLPVPNRSREEVREAAVDAALGLLVEQLA